MRPLISAAGLLLLLALPASAQENRSSDAASIAGEVDGVLLYARKGRIKKLRLGQNEPVDLGDGECARFSPDGKRIAVFDERRVFVMDADGKNRRQVFEGADWPEDGCAIAFHANGKEIIFVKKKEGLHTVRISDGQTTRMDLPGRYTGEISMSADGKKLTARWGHDLYAVDLVNKTHRKFAKGCSPGVSPDGRWLMNNTGGHHEMILRGWGEEQGEKVSGRAAEPDRSWDDFQWSNHPDFIVAAGDRKAEESYVVRLSDKRVFRATFEGKTKFPSLFVTRGGSKSAARAPKERQKERDDEREKVVAQPAPERRAPPEVTPARAPAPEVAAAAPVRPWPVEENGLVFAWADALKPNEIRGPEGRTLNCRVEPRDGATFSRHHGMELSGGSFVAEETAERWLQAVRARNELSVELVVTPRPGARGAILSWGDQLVLRQEGALLRLRLAGKGSKREGDLPLAALSDDRPTHLVVAYRPGLLVFYAQGVEIYRTTTNVDLRGFTAAPVLFGATGRDRPTWHGAIENVALYGTFLDAPVVADKARALEGAHKGRTPPQRFAVRARLVATTPIPTPASIEPYRRALVVGRYELITTVVGLPRQLQIARWSILDGRVVTTAARTKAGDEVTLTLEPWEGHPQLESERLVSEFDDAGARLFLDVTPVEPRDLPEPALARRR